MGMCYGEECYGPEPMDFYGHPEWAPIYEPEPHFEYFDYEPLVSIPREHDALTLPDWYTGDFGVPAEEEYYYEEPEERVIFYERSYAGYYPQYEAAYWEPELYYMDHYEPV